MNQNLIAFIKGGCAPDTCAAAGVYPHSVHTANGCTAFLASNNETDILVATTGFGFSGKFLIDDWVICNLTHENAQVLRQVFPFTAPSPVLKAPRTVGVGDRLGIATPGHICAVKKYDVYPVFAQQSIRELNLTNRTFENVLDCATYAVFREDFTRGFGADGDHLKTLQEIEYALSCGYTMITLDCSDHIHNEVMEMTDEQVITKYQPDLEVESRYMGKSFMVENYNITFDPMAFRRMSLIYNEAIDFAVSVYSKFFASCEKSLDFEISIDETDTPTDPAQHFYVASELTRRGVRPATIAPRFCGKFQKGVDYIGDLTQFEQEFAEHAAIARYFGYKISIHSGSDKFSIFSIIGKYTHGSFHLKTAGTSWLEAMLVIARHEPVLYREIYRYARDEAFEKASEFYNVSTDLTKIPDVDSFKDEDLPNLFMLNDVRQLIHITYGNILNLKNPDGEFVFRDRLYAAWRKYNEEYVLLLEKHIGKHIELLYSGFHE